ncbi:hypothetical protein Tco_0484188 [Tanacetum coccineum]
MKTPFKYLGVMVGGNMATGLKVWNETILKALSSCSIEWKINTLSIGGRLTLLKSVLGSTPIYSKSLYKVPKSILNLLESLRRNFFNGVQGDERKISMRVKLVEVKDARNLLDEFFLPKEEVATRWIKSIPIKVNVFAWKLHLDRLPTRLNLVNRGVQVLSTLWSYSEWLSWLKSLRLGSSLKLKGFWKEFFMFSGGVYGTFETTCSLRTNLLGVMFSLMILFLVLLIGVQLHVKTCLVGIAGFSTV